MTSIDYKTHKILYSAHHDTLHPYKDPIICTPPYIPTKILYYAHHTTLHPYKDLIFCTLWYHTPNSLQRSHVGMPVGQMSEYHILPLGNRVHHQHKTWESPHKQPGDLVSTTNCVYTTINDTQLKHDHSGDSPHKSIGRWLDCTPLEYSINQSFIIEIQRKLTLNKTDRRVLSLLLCTVV